ncbi:MAG: membrane integrity-associated transporter subunit PqiC [Herminiimonas sp.]|nr:membrane integrity-associated transporter subunit PqiC [Herminiimonas sp.]
MKIRSQNHPSSILRLAACSALVGAGLLGGCATGKSVETTAYDLGTLGPLDARSAVTIAPIAVADVSSAPWLDSQMMFFRLSYTNDQQPRPYATARWTMPPPQLLGQRIKVRMAQAGGAVLSGSDGAINLPLLRIEADDFSQRFDSPASSTVHVAFRASVLNGRLLVGQKTFDLEVPAAGADAPAGARALATTTDKLIGDMMVWLATLPAKR